MGFSGETSRFYQTAIFYAPLPPKTTNSSKQSHYWYICREQKESTCSFVVYPKLHLNGNILNKGLLSL